MKKNVNFSMNVYAKKTAKSEYLCKHGALMEDTTESAPPTNNYSLNMNNYTCKIPAFIQGGN